MTLDTLNETLNEVSRRLNLRDLEVELNETFKPPAISIFQCCGICSKILYEQTENDKQLDGYCSTFKNTSLCRGGE